MKKNNFLIPLNFLAKPILIKSILVLTLGFYSALWSQGIISSQNPSEEKRLLAAYDYLNAIRERTGLVTLKRNLALEKAAYSHSVYLYNENKQSHGQSTTSRSFSGRTANDRAERYGYEGTISENIAFEDTPKKSIDGLMTAIYHRFGFLDNTINEVGLGYVVNLKNKPPYDVGKHTFNMGNSFQRLLCKNYQGAVKKSYYTPCLNKNLKIDVDDWDNITLSIQKNSPSIITWPLDGEQNFTPVFYEESPDPLPDYSMSGNPISIQFNPTHYKSVRISRFELFQMVGGKEVKINHTRFILQSNDPNRKFSKFDFALFPLNRLDWNTPYRVRANYQAIDKSGKQVNEKITLNFKTQSIPQELGLGLTPVIVGNHKQELFVEPNKPTLIYIKTQPFTSHVKSFRSYIRDEISQNLDPTTIDSNTFLIDYNSPACSRVQFDTFTPYNKKILTFYVNVLPLQTRSAVSPSVEESRNILKKCKKYLHQKTIKNLKGEMISGQGDVVYIKSGSQIFVSIIPKITDKPLGSVDARYSSGMRINFDFETKDTLKIKATGRKGNTAKFTFQNGKQFSLVIE